MPQRTDDDAVKVVAQRDDEKRKAFNILNLYQSFADLGYPVENQITTKTISGEDKSLVVRDPTANFALDRATSGFIGAYIPRGRYFMYIRIKNRKLAEQDNVKWWCALATQITHDYLFDSNFMMQLHNTVKSDIGFGTACLFNEWDYKNRSLNFADWHVSQFTFKVNAKRRVDTVYLSYKRQARNIVDDFSDPGEQIVKAAEKIETESKLFDIIHAIRPRIGGTYSFFNKNNMPWESIFVNETEKHTMKKGGFPRFPCAVPRWEVGSCEKWGRGRGVQMLSYIKDLQQLDMDYMESSNRWNRPPYAKRSDLVEGEVNMKPDGCTDVTGENAITPLNPTLYGSAPITRETIEYRQKIVKEGFYNDLFNQFTQLQGDRRTTTEIQLRYGETLQQMISPVSRQEVELFTATLENVIPNLIEWGKIPAPPPELRGQEYTIEYQGKLAMAMREMQANGFERSVAMLGQLTPLIPNVMDIINLDRALPDMLFTYGLKAEHLSTAEELAEKRNKRAQDEQQVKMAQAAQIASEAYSKTTGAPEKGSPAAQLVGQGV